MKSMTMITPNLRTLQLDSVWVVRRWITGACIGASSGVLWPLVFNFGALCKPPSTHNQSPSGTRQSDIFVLTEGGNSVTSAIEQSLNVHAG